MIPRPLAMPPRIQKRPAAAEGEHESKTKQSKTKHVHPLVPAWTHAALNSGSTLADIYAEVRKKVDIPQGHVIRVATALPNTLSPMPTLMEVMPEAHYALAAIYCKNQAGYALVGKYKADHVYAGLSCDPGACECLKHGCCSTGYTGTVDVMLSSSECSGAVLDEVEPSLVSSSRSDQSRLVSSSRSDQSRLVYVIAVGMSAITEVTFCSNQSVPIMAFVSEKERFRDQLDEAVSKNEALSKTHRITGLRMEIGKTGLPHRSARWIFIVLPRTFTTDPIRILQSMPVSTRCVPLESIIDAVSSDLCAGWKALSKKRNEGNKQKGEASKQEEGEASKQEHDILPAGINPGDILARHPYCKKAIDAAVVATGNPCSKKAIDARIASLLYWMEQQNSAEGVVDVSKKAPVCVDGTIPDTNGKKVYVHRSSKKAISLTPYHVLSTLGYIPALHNLAACTPSVADAASKKALPCTLIFACLLACSKTLSDNRSAAV